MDQKAFDGIVDGQLTHCLAILRPKGLEYTRGADRLHQFKRAGSILRCTPAQACVGLSVKHLTSILDIVQDSANGLSPTLATLDEKFGDFINYLLLLRACIQEGLDTDRELVHEFRA